MSETNTNWIKKNYGILVLCCIVILSFSLFMYSLIQYPISYGPDGPYYDIQVRYILRTGLPSSNDPPLLYYFLTPFVMITGDSYLGIKIGMSVISAAMAIPAYFLTETFTEKLEIESKIPSLLCAFLVSVNVYNLRMIEDFMQQIGATFFLLWFFYFAVRWFEDIRSWKRNGILTGIFLVCTIFTHIYPGLIALIILGALLLFNFIGKMIKTRKVPKSELKIIGLIGLGFVGIIIGGIILFPSTLSNILTRLESFMSDFTTGSDKDSLMFISNALVFLTLPTLIGVVIGAVYLIKGLKGRVSEDEKSPISKETFLVWICLILFGLILFLSILSTSWQERFVLLSFVPIALLTALGVKFIEKQLARTYPNKKGIKNLIISGFAVIFCISTTIHAIQFTESMGPILTTEQYEELEFISTSYIPDTIDPTGIFAVQSYHFGYWITYIFDMDSTTANVSDNIDLYSGREIYGINEIKMVPQPFSPTFSYPWYIFLPLSAHKTYLDQQVISLQPTAPLVIHHGEYYEVYLMYYANGTKV